MQKSWFLSVSQVAILTQVNERDVSRWFQTMRKIPGAVVRSDGDDQRAAFVSCRALIAFLKSKGFNNRITPQLLAIEKQQTEAESVDGESKPEPEKEPDRELTPAPLDDNDPDVLVDLHAVARRLNFLITTADKKSSPGEFAKLADTYVKIIRAIDEMDERAGRLLPTDIVRDAEMQAAEQTCAAFDRIAERGRIAAGLSQEQADKLRELIAEERFALRERLLSEVDKILTGKKSHENRDDETGAEEIKTE